MKGEGEGKGGEKTAECRREVESEERRVFHLAASFGSR